MFRALYSPPTWIGHFDTLFTLPLLVVASLLLLGLQYALPPTYRYINKKFSSRKPYQPLNGGDAIEEDEAPAVASRAPPLQVESEGLLKDFIKHVKVIGVWDVAFEVVRFACLAALCGLSIYAAIQAPRPDNHAAGFEEDSSMDTLKHGLGGKKHKKKHGHKKKQHHQPLLRAFSLPEWEELGLSAFYLYASIVAFATLIISAGRLRSVLGIHRNILLFVAWCMFVYRDLYPVATVYLSPLDPGWLGWVRFGLLSATAVVIPLFKPRKYSPVDPANPQPTPHPEQTAPIISVIFFQFMDDLVRRAWKVESLDYDEFPPMTDYDRSSWLSRQHMYKLDPVVRKERGLKPHHLFVGIAQTFWKDYLVLMAMLVLRTIADFLAPIGINRLLTYLASGGKGATTRPWVWVLWLFLGPALGSISFQYYIYTTTRLISRFEAIFTELLFTHSLRIKMRDEAAPPTTTGLTAPATGAQTPAIIIEDTTDVIEGHVGVDGAQAQDGMIVATTNDAGKAKADAAVAAATNTTADSAPSAAAKGGDIVGRINTLISSDIDNIVEGRDFMLLLFYSPLQVSLAVVFLTQILSWSALIGMLVLVATLPLPGLCAKYMNDTQKLLMEASEARIGKITEAVNSLRMIKSFAWEAKVKEQLAEKREIELQLSRKKQIINQISNTLNYFLPVLTIVTTYAFYTAVQGRTLTAAKIFSSISVFDLIRDQLYMGTWQITTSIQAKVSVQRVNAFLNETELLQEFEDDLPQGEKQGEQIVVTKAEFAWNKESDRNFKLYVDDLRFPEGKISIIAGATGSGKSSLLMALLGEMIYQPTASDSQFVLPRANGVAYSAQSSWVMAGTIRENILFGSPYDEARYKAVLRQCALEKDLELFDAGDQTELGEKGLNASGGQKARIALARAVYSPARIVLLDDVLSALDVHTSRHIVEHCFKGTLLRDRTVVLVTHHIAMVSPTAHYIVKLADGIIQSQGPVDEVVMADEELKEAITEEAEKEEEEATKEEEQVAPKEVTETAGRLVVAEEKAIGRVSRSALFEFFKVMGGPVFWTLFPISYTICEFWASAVPYWLGIWSRAYDATDDPRSVSVVYYLGIYLALMMGQVLLWNFTHFAYVLAGIRASRRLHQKLVERIFGSTMRFLDTTPVGRILARMTKDIKTVDGSFQMQFVSVVEVTLGLVSKFGYILVLVPVFTPAAVLIGALGAGLGEVYIHAQLAVKREMSNAKSPLYSQMAAAVAGIVSIRAYGSQTRFLHDARTRIDKYTRCSVTFYNLNRWVTVRIDTLGGIFAAGLAAVVTYGKFLDASAAGFSLTLAVSVSQYILWWVRILNQFEVESNSVERIVDYFKIELEEAATAQGKPPAAWPTSGSVQLQNLSARYSKDGPIVLDNLNVDIKAGQRVGIVGRTGSGKSTLSLALLRLIPTEGSVVIDGIDTKKINLDSLRTHVTIIPQDPVLLSGTLRFNLDPFDERDDADLYDAMQSSGLSMARQSADGASTPMAISLETTIATGGSNLSQGQRQLVALARALVRRSKILILDEATASVDFETDSLVQQAIANLKDTTVLTIAHRLETIMTYDKILVLGAGKMLEYDSPSELLKNEKGFLRGLVDNSGQTEHLEKLASGQGSA